MAIYHANDAIVEEGDAVANLGVPLALLQHGRLAFFPRDNPEMFNWRSLAPMFERDDLYVRTWMWVVDQDFAYRWRDRGKIEFNGVRYFAVKASKRPGYVSTFGPVPGFTLIPLVQLMLSVDDNFPHKTPLKWSVAKLQASAMIAGSAVFLFLLALELTTRGRALFLAWAYGLGTCVWTISSQTIWQQTVNIFMLTCGVYILFCRKKTQEMAALAGFMLGSALACRHTSLLILGPLGLYVLLRERHRIIPFVVGAMPMPLIVAVYNIYFFGSPFSFAQELVGHEIAMQKTGSPDLWQTPLLEGFVGLTASPSRGVLFFSPFLVLAGWGIVRIWRRRELEWLRPLTLGTVAIMAMQCKWFDWWGGWSYGYRPWLDAVPFLMLFMAAVIDSLWARSVPRYLFAVAVGWSIAVQALGAFSYDKSWNERTYFVLEDPDGNRVRIADNAYEAQSIVQEIGGKFVGQYHCNVDVPRCRYRLWSMEESILLYYVKNFGHARRRRWPSGWHFLRY